MFEYILFSFFTMMKETLLSRIWIFRLGFTEIKHYLSLFQSSLCLLFHKRLGYL